MQTYKIVTATGFPVLNKTLASREEINVIGNCTFKSDIMSTIGELHPDILMVTDKISGDENLIQLLLDCKRTYPDLRILYFAGQISSKDMSRVDSLGTLVLLGIYDIDTSPKLNIDIVMDLILNPKSKAAVDYLTKHLMNREQEIENAAGGIEYEEYEEDRIEESITMDNLYVFASIKPGSGKSFVSANIACALAKYGKDKPNMPADLRRPKIAFIEGDLQTLSVGTLLGVDEEKYKDKNMKYAMTYISQLFDHGELIDDDEKIKKLNRKIKDCFIPYKTLSNLHILVGSSMTPEEIDSLNISSQYYAYLVDMLRSEYDIILVDTNSSLFHVSTFPLLQKAKSIYYILNLDFNNVRNNVRYRKTLKDLGFLDKTKYILNECVENTPEFIDSGVNIEELNFTADYIDGKYFDLEARIPVLPKTVFLNRLYEGTPVVLDDNKVDYTNKAKLELLNIANNIYPLDDTYEQLKNKVAHIKKPGFFSTFFRKKPKEEDIHTIKARQYTSKEIDERMDIDESDNSSTTV